MESPGIMDNDTLRFRRLLERLGKGHEKAGHLHHRGKVRSVDDEKGRSYELACECGVTLGPWRISEPLGLRGGPDIRIT
jgi:hypothetical protein